MLRVLDHFEIERAVVIGHSMGGFVSVLPAAMHPDRVSSLVLVAGGLPIAPPADYGLDGVEPHLHSSADPNAIAENSLQMDGSEGYSEALHSLDLPIDFLRAPRGLLDAAPLYTPVDVARETAGIPQIRTHEVQDVNHYTTVLSDRGADQVAPVIGAHIERATVPAGKETL